MIIQSDNDRLILWSAFRYALGRMTYIVDVVAGEIKRNAHRLDSLDKKKMCDEIEEAISRGEAGQNCDIAVWQSVVDALSPNGVSLNGEKNGQA